MSEFIDKRSDDEILADRATVQLYIDKLLHIFKNVLDSDQRHFGLLFEAILLYARSADESLISKERDPITWSAFQQYKYELDADTSKFLAKSRKNAAAGHKGGSKNKQTLANANERKQNNPNTTSGYGSGHGYGHGQGNEYLNMIESEELNNDD